MLVACSGWDELFVKLNAEVAGGLLTETKGQYHVEYLEAILKECSQKKNVLAPEPAVRLSSPQTGSSAARDFSVSRAFPTCGVD